MARSCCVLAFIVLMFLCGCKTSVHLIQPLPDEKLDITGGTSPAFAWEIPGYDDPAFYHLEVATDQYFSDMVLSKENLEVTEFQPDEEDVFFPGDTKYFWRVTGYDRNRYGENEEIFACSSPRSFYINPRPTVSVLIKIPPADRKKGLTVQMGDEIFDRDFEKKMEVGEWRTLTAILNKVGKIRQIGGRLNVLASNETTKLGSIIVDSITAERMDEILEGNVGNYSFTLGGDKIVTLQLGSRTE